MRRKYILFFILIVISILISYFLSIYDFVFHVMGLVGFVVEFSVLIAVIVIYLFISIIDRKIYFLELILLIVCLFGLYKANLLSRDFITSNEQKSIQQGNIIINALDKYFIDSKCYPNKLDELKPKYLEEVPKSQVFISKHEFDYSYFKDKNKYRISFRIPAFALYKYDSEYKKWYQAD